MQNVRILPRGCDVNAAPALASEIGKLSAWARIVESRYPVSAPLFVAEKGGEVFGVCMGYFHRSGGPASTLYVPRFATIARDGATEKAVLVAIGDHARMQGLRRSVVAYDKASLGEYFCWKKTTVTLTLVSDSDVMFAALRAKSRNTVRRAAEVFEVLIDQNYLDEFYQAYAARMEGKGLATHPIEFFQSLFAGAADCELMVARRAGVIEAGMIWRQSNQTAHYLFNAATSEGLRNNANHLLMWEAMRHYSARRVEILDLGESSPNGGVYAFKTVQFGGVPMEVRYADILCGAGAERSAAPLPWHFRLATRIGGVLPISLDRRLELAKQGYGRLLW